MQSGQFVIGKIDGIQKYFKTENLREILPKTKLTELETYTEIGEYPRFFKIEKVLSKTIVSAADNTDGRPGGIINRTVLYKFDQTITKDAVNYVFPLDDFIAEILAGKRRFKMPPMPELPNTDMGLVDLPPPIEWEVSSN